jgi:hypothetical protein
MDERGRDGDDIERRGDLLAITPSVKVLRRL